MIKKYTMKNGETRYLFQTYLGVDPLTGKERRTTRRGFKTIKEAKQAERNLLLDVEENGPLKMLLIYGMRIIKPPSRLLRLSTRNKNLII